MDTEAGGGAAAATGGYTDTEGGQGDGYAAEYADPNADYDAYYEYGGDGTDTYAAYYGAEGAGNYADGAAAGEYEQPYDEQAYDASYAAGGDGSGGESPTATALPDTLWYQEAQALDAGERLMEAVSELQLDHSMGMYGSPESPTRWDQDDGDELEPLGPETAGAGGISGPATLDHNQERSVAKTAIAAPPKPKKARQQRIQKRQERLERQEEGSSTANAVNTPPTDAKARSKGALVRKPSFIGREKAKMQLKLRIARAIARKRMPLQVRILTETRKHLSPLEKYFGGPVESVLSDIFWAAIKGDAERVQFLVQVEGVDPTDGTLDPWNLGQTPLHWAAKGGSVEVVELLLRTGANPRGLDANGSLPLQVLCHLACWAGHADAALALLRASNVRDLYLPDYDAGLAPLNWASIRGHAGLIKAIEKYEDTLWLPKFIDDLLRGIVKYKIKLFKDPPKANKGVATASTDAVVNTVSGETAVPVVVTPETPPPTATTTEEVSSTTSSTTKKKTKL